MAEENQVTTKGVEENRVTTKNPKKVEVGRRLAEYNHKKKEELKMQKSEVEPMLDSSQHYGIGGRSSFGGNRWSWLLPLPSQKRQCCTSATMPSN